MAPSKKSKGQRIADALVQQDSFDPADVDTLGDETTAGKKRFSAFEGVAGGLKQEKGRLRMRAKVPVLEEYKGKKVNRKEVFEEGEDVSDDADLDELDGIGDDGSDDGDDDDDAGIVAGATAGGFTISGDMEKEYEKMMKTTESELEIMRQPSSEDLEKRESDAKALKQQLEVWSSLVELRIHLEAALGIGHRLPVGDNFAAFRSANPAVAQEVDAASKDVRGLAGSLLSLQEGLAKQHGLDPSSAASSASSKGRPGSEASSWHALDARVEPVMDWALGVADDWKERTRLDARRGFKVLDQSFRVQMQAVAEADSEKMRRRCTPLPGKHKVFTASEAEEGNDEAVEKEDASVEDIFDDRDFYVQLLREVLGANSSNMLGGEDKELQAELQGRRATKRKAKEEVERRASKGRKIRYKPIEKMQNFMSGRPRGTFSGNNSISGLETEQLSDGAIEALLRSLFARPKSSAQLR
eukprot:TRINITY_DN24332_c0_g2_i1.p1 TRINITY_DN24332_c0_g2~~TRINITY_DN24332_c0_g2_i1.p1  ORF type:complete len:496 (-),score=149.51 TRINITY_DN24332_c0_g2_i1:179-1588(-)